jgi:hypothetical protein
VKPRFALSFFALSSIEGVILLVSLLGSRSDQEQAIFGGFSGQKLALISLVLAALIVLGGLWLVAWLQKGWAERLSSRLDKWLRSPETLLVVSFFLVMILLVIPAFWLVGLKLGYSLVVQRLAGLMIWAALLGIQMLGVLWLSYAPLYRQPDFFSHAPRKIADASFLGKPAFWISIGLLVLTVVVLIPSSSISMARVPSNDSGIFLYFGQQILRGKIPFRDLWDHKPPMIFYVDALGLLIGHGSTWGVWALEYLALAGSSLIGFAILRGYYGKLPAALAVGASLAGTVFLLEGGNLTEEFSLPLQWGAIFLFALSDRMGWSGRSGALRALVIGILFSITLNFKQTMIGIWVALFFWLGLCWWFQKKRYLWKVFAWAAIGALSTMAIIVIYYAFERTLGEYWNVAYVYNFLYSDISSDQRFSAVSEMVNFLIHLTPLFPLALLAWVIGLWSTLRAILRHEYLLPFPFIAALIDLPIELVLISTSGKNYYHYFMSMVPVATILAAWGLAELTKSNRRIPHWGAILTALLLTGLVAVPAASKLISMTKPSSEVTITQTVQLIKNETNSHDYVLLWGSQAVVNFLADRPAPSRFVLQKALFRTGFASQALSNEMLNDLQTRTPALIIDTHLAETPFITSAADGSCTIPSHTHAGMEAVFDFICKHYRLEQVISKDQWDVYRYSN